MNRAAALASLALLVPIAAHAAWEAEVAANGMRSATVTGEAKVGERTLAATLELRCLPGAEGTIGWALEVEGAGGEAGFDFDAFEGPDAPAAREPRGTLALSGGLLQPRFETPVSGAFLGPQRFAFAFIAPAQAASPAALLADSINPQTTTLTWRVRDPADVILEARFDARDAVAATSPTMYGCGPVPELPPALGARLETLSPERMLAQRAVAWRVHALLGAGAPPVLARLSAGAPVAREGDVLYVLAPGQNAGDGAVLMLALGGTSVEVLLLDEGRPLRHVGGAPITAPAAVREFVAARTR